MLSNMSTELIEIDPAVLRDLLKKRGLTRYDLAQRLEISTKTIQRWLNYSVRRIKHETLMKLAEALETSPEELRKNSPTVSVRTTDRAVEEICSDTFFDRIRLADDWASYLSLLKTIHAGQLSTEQRLTLFKNIGVSSFYLSKFRASRLYLEQAMQLAELLDVPFQKVDIANWSARRAETMGNLDLAQYYLDQTTKLLPIQNCMKTLAEYSYVRSRVHLHREEYTDALFHIRQGILAEYQRDTTPNAMLISVKYVHMVHIYIRQKDYSRARLACKRLQRASEKSGWVRGSALAHYYLATIHYFTMGPSDSTQRIYGKARQLYKYAIGKRYCPLTAQSEFLYLLLHQRYAEAKSLLLHRLQKTRNSHLYFSMTVLDGLLLAKLHPQTLTMRPSFIEKAKDYFKKQGLVTALLLVEDLQKRDKIHHSELPDFYLI